MKCPCGQQLSMRSLLIMRSGRRLNLSMHMAQEGVVTTAVHVAVEYRAHKTDETEQVRVKSSRKP